MDERELARLHARDGADALLEPVAEEILAEGRDERPHAKGRSLVQGLRRGHAALPSGAARRRVPHWLRELLLPGARPARRAAARRGRESLQPRGGVPLRMSALLLQPSL